jgi:outer membrane protein assembly factor BamB
MFFKLSDTIEKVKTAGFSTDVLIYREKSGNVLGWDGNGANVIARNMKDFMPGMSFLFCLTSEKDLQVYKKDELIKQFEGPFSAMHFFNNGDSVVVLKKEPEGGKYYKIDTALNAVPYNWYNSNLVDIKGNYFFVRRGQIFSCHHVSDGHELWNFDVYEVSGETEGTVTRDLIVYNDRLFLGLVTGTVLCLELATGKIIERISLGVGRIKYYEGRIYGAEEQKVRVLDPETLQVNRIDLTTAFKEQGFSIVTNMFVPQGDELYFKNENTPVIGVVKLSTQELLWHSEIPIEEGNYWIDDLGVQGDKLYVLTQGGTLRIFEKQK